MLGTYSIAKHEREREVLKHKFIGNDGLKDLTVKTTRLLS